MPNRLRYTLAVFNKGEAVFAYETVLPFIGEMAFQTLSRAWPHGLRPSREMRRDAWN